MPQFSNSALLPIIKIRIVLILWRHFGRYAFSFPGEGESGNCRLSGIEAADRLSAASAPLAFVRTAAARRLEAAIEK